MTNLLANYMRDVALLTNQDNEKKEDFEVFDKHPDHQRLVKKIIPKLDSGSAMDFIPISI